MYVQVIAQAAKVFEIYSTSNTIEIVEVKQSAIYCFTSAINPEYGSYLCYHSLIVYSVLASKVDSLF